MSNDPLDLHRRRGPSSSSALRPGGIHPTPNGSSCDSGDTCGRSGGGSEGQRPLSVKGASRRQAQTLGVTILAPPRVQPSAVATRPHWHSRLFAGFLSGTSRRSCSYCAASLSRAAPSYGAWPASSRAAARLTLGAARFVRRAPTAPGHAHVRARLPAGEFGREVLILTGPFTGRKCPSLGSLVGDR